MDAFSSPSRSTPSNYQIPLGILDDLCSRFIINIPEEARQDMIRIFFQIELAHWFYLDFYCQEKPDLKACGIKEFSTLVFQHCPTLTQHAGNVDKILEKWRDYKMAVPTYGAIMLDPTLQHCLLVQGYWARASWGFPKGKVNEQEISHDCAIREVLEETGFDIGAYLDHEEYIEYKMNEQLSRLYIVPGIDMSTNFQPRTRKEIKKIDWFPVNHLPAHKKDLVCKQFTGLNPNSFFMVIPFVRPLRKWIARKLSRPPDLSDSDHNNSGNYGKLGGRYGRNQGSTTPRQAGERQRRQSHHHHSEQEEQATHTTTPRQKHHQQHQQQQGRDQRTRSASPVSTSQGGHKEHRRPYNMSPGGKKQQQQQQQPQYQILKRGESKPGIPSRKNLDFTAGEVHGKKGKKHQQQQHQQQQQQQQQQPNQQQEAQSSPFFSKTWANFYLDINSAMSAMFPKANHSHSVSTN